MAFNSKGEWVPENDSVADKVTSLTASSSPYIQQARASGLQAANRRGLLNSSMAAAASQGAAIDRALPIASQDAQQISQKNLTKMQADSDMERQRLVTSSADRNASLSAALEANKAYLAAFGQIADNDKIPAATRDAYIRHLLDTRATGLDMIQQIYGIQLDWGAGSGGTPAPSSGTFLPPAAPAGMSKKERAAFDKQVAADRLQATSAYGSGSLFR